MRRNKAFVACTIAGMMLVSGIAGCTTDTSDPTTTATETGIPDGSENGTDASENDYGWLVPEDTIRFSVYAGYGDQENFIADEHGGKAYYDQWLLENFNVEIQWEFNSIDMDERLNMLLVSGDYPDVITWMSDDMANRFIDQSKAADLTDLLSEHGDNITRRLGNYVNFLRSDDERIYKLAHYWGENPNVAGHDFGVRYDYWLELGESEIYQTPAEYIQTVKAILDNHPENDFGQPTYAFTSANQGENFLTAMLGAYGFINSYKADDNGTFHHWINTDEGYELSQIVNEMYREGLIDPDYLSNGYEEYVNKLSNGQIIANLGTWWYAWTGGHEIWAIDEGEDYNIEKRFMNVSIAGEGIDIDETTLLTSNFIGSYRTIITDNAENVADILKFINWQNSELGNFISGWGPPAETNVWNIDAEGNWVVDDAILDTDRKEANFHQPRQEHGANIYPLAINMNWLKTDDYSDFSRIDPRVDRVSAYDYWPVEPDGSFSNEGINITWQYYTASARDITLYQTSFSPADQITITNQTIRDTTINEWAKIMTAESLAAFEAQFEESRNTLNALGLQELTEYYQASYENNLEIYENE